MQSVLSFIVIVSFIIWKMGRIYCGWLCPHFSVVEIFNDMMLKYLNRVTIWEKASTKTNGMLPWILVFFSCALMAFVWAFSLLTQPCEMISPEHSCVNPVIVNAIETVLCAYIRVVSNEQNLPVLNAVNVLMPVTRCSMIIRMVG